MLKTLRAYLQLMRFPAVFTAIADVCLGFLLTHPTFEPVTTFALLAAASSCLYLSGMVLNDVFDRDIDRVERSQRPIPSGRVPLRNAVLLGSGLMLAGILFALYAGSPSLTVAAILAGCIVAYDGGGKRTVLGPLLMGGCRFLNVALGASAGGEPWTSPQLEIAMILGVYVVGITWFARQEAGESSRWQLGGAIVVINCAFACLVALVTLFENPDLEPMIVLFLVAMIVVTVDRRLFRALSDPSPARVQTAVKMALLSLVTIDATLIYWARGEPMYAIGVALLLVPAMLLGRVIFIT